MTILAIPDDLTVWLPAPPEGWDKQTTAGEIMARPTQIIPVFTGVFDLSPVPEGTFVFGVGWHSSYSGQGFEDISAMVLPLAARLAEISGMWGTASTGSAYVAALPVTDITFRYTVTREPLPSEVLSVARSVNKKYEHQMADVPRYPFTPEEMRGFLRECVTVVKPGETLIIRAPTNWSPYQLETYSLRLHEVLEGMGKPFRALVLIGEELAVAEAAGS